MMSPSRASITRFRPRPHHILFALLALCAISYTILWDNEKGSILGGGLREHRQLTFLDADGHDDAKSMQAQYQALVQPSRIDSSVSDRLPTHNQESNEDDLCDDVLLYMPHTVAHEGHAAQLNSYLLAAMIATFTNKALVILDSPQDHNEYKSNSQFGCPREAWLTNSETGKKNGWDRSFPTGLGRLLDTPSWLSGGCSVPCGAKYDYRAWDYMRTQRHKDDAYYPKLYTPHQVECVSGDGGRQTEVLVVGGQELRDYFEGHFRERMVQRPSDIAYGWAMRLGAQEAEAEKFAELEGEQDVFDYVSALLAHSGVLKFQPWIARDVQEYITKSGLPLDADYDAIHVRRGIKPKGAFDFVTKYWGERSGPNPDEDDVKDYIPLTHYLEQYDDLECNYVPKHVTFATRLLSNLVIVPEEEKEKPRRVYIATDNPMQVLSEIKKLPKDDYGNTIENQCHKFQFVTGPYDPKERFVGFHLQDGPTKGDCGGRYTRNIAAVADMMIAARSDRFIGEFNSGWGRLVRIFRMQLEDSNSEGDGSDGASVVEKDIKVAWGDEERLPPGL